MSARGVVFCLAVLALLVPAALLTAGRVFEPDRETWIKVEAFTPLAVGLYGAALIALLVRLLVLRRWTFLAF